MHFIRNEKKNNSPFLYSVAIYFYHITSTGGTQKNSASEFHILRGQRIVLLNSISCEAKLDIMDRDNISLYFSVFHKHAD